MYSAYLSQRLRCEDEYGTSSKVGADMDDMAPGMSGSHQLISNFTKLARSSHGS